MTYSMIWSMEWYMRVALNHWKSLLLQARTWHRRGGVAREVNAGRHACAPSPFRATHPKHHSRLSVPNHAARCFVLFTMNVL